MLKIRVIPLHIPTKIAALTLAKSDVCFDDDYTLDKLQVLRNEINELCGGFPSTNDAYQQMILAARPLGRFVACKVIVAFERHAQWEAPARKGGVL